MNPTKWNDIDRLFVCINIDVNIDNRFVIEQVMIIAIIEIVYDNKSLYDLNSLKMIYRKDMIAITIMMINNRHCMTVAVTDIPSTPRTVFHQAVSMVIKSVDEIIETVHRFCQ